MSYAGEVNLLPIGIDCMTINYDDPKEVGVAFTHNLYLLRDNQPVLCCPIWRYCF